MSNPEANPDSHADLRAQIIEVLKSVQDPEIPVNIYELGLIYNIDISDESNVHIRMTLTTPNCPVAEELPPEVEGKVKAIPGVNDAKVEIVWEPVWTKDRMSPAARLQLNMDLDDIPAHNPKSKFTRLGRIK